MADYETKLNRITVHYNGLFDFDGLYAAIIDWAKNYGFMWNETTFKHKVPSPKGAEQEFEWVLTRDTTDYIRYTITFTVHVWDLLEVEVEADGKKRALSNARLYLWIDPKVTGDWQKKFQKSGKLGKLLGKWYNRLFEREYYSHCDDLYYQSWDIHAIIKAYFDLQAKSYAYKGYLGKG